MQATIYIPKDKAHVYEQAKEKLADSISETFVRCLESALDRQKTATERIIIEVVRSGDRREKKSFEGAWIIGDAGNGESFIFEGGLHDGSVTGGGDYSVARTKRGAILVCEFDRHGEEIENYRVFLDFDEFKNAKTAGAPGYPLFPESLISAVADGIGENYIEDLDI